MSGTPYSQDEINWLKENSSKYSTVQFLHEAFCENFPYRGLEGFKTKISKLKLKRENKGTFAHRKKDDLPIGTERYGQNGTCYIKVANNYSGERNSGYKPPYWIPKQRKIYEDAFGEIPANCMVVFLNQDTTDYSLENLYCIDRKILVRMNQNHWFTDSRENTLTAIKLCELWEELKRMKGV